MLLKGLNAVICVLDTNEHLSVFVITVAVIDDVILFIVQDTLK